MLRRATLRKREEELLPRVSPDFCLYNIYAMLNQHKHFEDLTRWHFGSLMMSRAAGTISLVEIALAGIKAMGNPTSLISDTTLEIHQTKTTRLVEIDYPF